MAMDDNKKYSYVLTVEDPVIKEWLKTQINKKTSLLLLIKFAIKQYGVQDLQSMFLNQLTDNMNLNNQPTNNVSATATTEQPTVPQNSTATPANSQISNIPPQASASLRQTMDQTFDPNNTTPIEDPTANSNNQSGVNKNTLGMLFGDNKN